MHGLALKPRSVWLLGGRSAGTLLTSLTLKYYGEQLDLEAFLQEMPDYLVAEMGRYVGSQFDGAVVDALLRVLDSVEAPTVY